LTGGGSIGASAEVTLVDGEKSRKPK